VVNDANEGLGIMAISKAIDLAKEQGLDLIEIAPQATPPVVKIMSFDKFRYQKEKDDKKQQREQKSKDLKQVRISPRAAKNDLEIKIKRTEEFLEKGHRVEINLFLKGREKAHKDWGLKKMEEFLQMIKVPHQLAAPPRDAGRGYAVQIYKKK